MAMAPPSWPRHCMGLIGLPMSAACTLCRVMISPVNTMHGNAHALDIEPDRTRREIRFAPHVDAIPGPSSCRVNLGERDLPVGANDGVVPQSAIGSLAGANGGRQRR